MADCFSSIALVCQALPGTGNFKMRKCCCFLELGRFVATECETNK